MQVINKYLIAYVSIFVQRTYLDPYTRFFLYFLMPPSI